MNFKIVYCVPCGYITRAEWLKKDLESKFEKAKVELEGGKGGVFDVFADGELIFSKHKELRFPENEEIANLVKK